jgi:Spy/CpxP family protein refolding chaperone
MSIRHLPLISTIAFVSLGSIPVLAHYIPNWQVGDRGNSNNMLLAQYQQFANNKPPSLNKLIEQLDLTDEQRQKIAMVRQKYKQPIAQLRQNLSSTQRELAQMMAGVDSVPTIRRKHGEVIQLQQKMGNLSLASMLEIRQVLTPEQRQQLVQIMQSRRDNWR